MILKELVHELIKLSRLSPEAGEWPVQIMFFSDDKTIYDNEDLLHVCVDEDVVTLVGKSAE